MTLCWAYPVRVASHLLMLARCIHHLKPICLCYSIAGLQQNTIAGVEAHGEQGESGVAAVRAEGRASEGLQLQLEAEARSNTRHTCWVARVSWMGNTISSCSDQVQICILCSALLHGMRRI